MFIQRLESSQIEYISNFKDQTIEMDDFSLRISNLPEDLLYKNRELDLKKLLTHHFNSLVQELRKADREGMMRVAVDGVEEEDVDKDKEVMLED